MTSGIGGAGGGGPKIGGATGPVAPPPTAPTSGASGPKGASFGETLGSKAAGTEQAGGASPLEKLRSGELDLKGYVEVRVREATAHLDGLVAPDDLAKIQDQLRDAIENDPDIAALVKGAEDGR